MAITRGGYFKIVWRRAWAFAWSATRSWSGLAAIAIGLVALRVQYVRDWRTNASWEIPLGMLFVLLVYGTAKASYSLYAEKDSLADSLQERLTDKTDHQALADSLTERYMMATHHLLNVIGPAGVPSSGWDSQANIWRESVLKILTDYGCSKQEVTHFEVINQFEMLALRLPVSTAMFLIRVTRLTDIATSHAKIADEQLIRKKLTAPPSASSSA